MPSHLTQYTVKPQAGREKSITCMSNCHSLGLLVLLSGRRSLWAEFAPPTTQFSTRDRGTYRDTPRTHAHSRTHVLCQTTILHHRGFSNINTTCSSTSSRLPSPSNPKESSSSPSLQAGCYDLPQLTRSRCSPNSPRQSQSTTWSRIITEPRLPSPTTTL